jgi:hypothetical protein
MLEIQPRLVGGCVILVGNSEVTPATPHLFALLLVLVIGERDPWTRPALQDLLFPGVVGSGHRLRQLLYRLRATGVVLQEGDGPLRVRNPVGDPLGPSADARDVGSLRVLPHYSPRLSAPFLDWLESARDALQRRLHERELARLRAARERHDWEAASSIALALQLLDPMSEEIASAAAESQAMLGNRDAALDVIDRFVRESGEPLTTRPSLQRLRTRIVAARPLQRDGTLRGRQECLAVLSDQWERTVSGGGRACIVFGPAGMGKTRVGETFAAAVRLNAGKVLSYRCDEQNRRSPLALFSLIVRDLRQMRGSIGASPALRSALDDLAPESIVAPAPVTDSDGRREVLRRAIVDLFEAVTDERPLLLMIDDAHLLDDPSRAVVRSIAAEANGARVLIVLLCRPRPDDATLVSTSGRMIAYTLPPLSDEDSRALVFEISGDREPSPAQAEWAVRQAGGNAFYLHALARNPGEGASLPVHVRSLAHTSHHALSHDARTVLEACLLLDTLATIGRVTRASAMTDREMLVALRELEEADLLRHDGSILAGPHAIIRDALVELIPTSTSVLLNRRIAEMLSEECAQPGQARVVAWAAVNGWLAAGDFAAAVDLALKVARDAEGMGEPEAGAVLLNSIPREGLDADVQRNLLDQIIRLAGDGKCPGLVRESLAHRRELSMRTGESADTTADLTIRIVALEPLNHTANTRILSDIMVDEQLSTRTRLDARLRLLVEADNHFDSQLAAAAFNTVLAVSDGDASSLGADQRASLIYHTSFGDVRISLAIADDILTAYPLPSLDPVARHARSYAIVALLRLGCTDRVATLALEEYELNDLAGNLYFAELFGTIAADALTIAGDLRRVSALMAVIYRSFERRGLSEQIHPFNYYFSVAMVAMTAGAFSHARETLALGRRVHGTNICPRTECAFLSHACRLERLTGSPPSEDALADLAALHAMGASHTSQDSVVEELWHYYSARNEHDVGSRLLREYLLVRREIGPVDASLRLSTARDPAWQVSPGTQKCIDAPIHTVVPPLNPASRTRSAHRRSEPSATTALGSSVPGPQSMTP